MVTDLGLHHPGNPRASASSGQLQTTSGHHHPAPAQLILQRAEVGGQWSQPVLTAPSPGKIPTVDLPTATKAQLQEEGVLNPHKGCTSITHHPLTKQNINGSCFSMFILPGRWLPVGLSDRRIHVHGYLSLLAGHGDLGAPILIILFHQAIRGPSNITLDENA